MPVPPVPTATAPRRDGWIRAETSKPVAALAVMARRPAAGRVKTRLAAHVGAPKAADLYRRFLNDTISRAGRLSNVALYLALEPDADGSPDRPTQAEHDDDVLASVAPRAHWDSLIQRGDGLAARLAAVFADLFDSGYELAAIIGSDSPALPTSFLERAFDLLRGTPTDGRADAVLGPAMDGGYYLIATSARVWLDRKTALTELLAGSPMGTPTVTRHTLDGLRDLGLRVATLPYWFDVDTRDELALARGVLPEIGIGANSDTGVGASANTGANTVAAPRGTPLDRLREVYLHITHRCSTGCPQCYLRDARDEGTARPWELDTARWLDVIDQAVDLGAGAFVIIGGDPFLRTDLTDLIDHITGTHQASVRLFFNRRVDSKTAARLAAVGRGRLVPLISIDGTREVNDGLRGEGNFDAALSSIRVLLGAGLRPVVNTVMLRPVLHTLPALAEILAVEGVRTIHFILPHQRGGLANNLGMVPAGDELLQVLQAVEITAEAVGLNIDNLAAWRGRLRAPRDLCSAGCTLLAVDPEGLVHACPITCGDGGFVAGDLHDASLEDIWRASPVLELLRAAHARDRDTCRECPVVDACGGECWVQAHYAAAAAGGRAGYLAPFPYCGFVRPMLDKLGAGNQDRVGAPASVPASREEGGAWGGSQTELTPFDCI